MTENIYICLALDLPTVVFLPRQIPIPFLVASLLYREKIFGFKLSWEDNVDSKVNNSAAPKPAYGTIGAKQAGESTRARRLSRRTAPSAPSKQVSQQQRGT